MKTGAMRTTLAVLLVSCAVLSACGGRAATGPPPGMTGIEAPRPMAPLMSKLASEGERNWVLNLNTIAIEALRQGDRELAKRALDESILNINAVFGSTPSARKARTLFFDEDVKLFKGDPYERSLTFFYRGVLYMQDGDYENARASFRSAVLQDAFAEEEQYRADWTVFDYMIGVCEMQLGNTEYAMEAYGRAAAAYRQTAASYRTVVGVHRGGELPVEPVAARDNLLVIAQAGRGPRKFRAGPHGEFLSIGRGATGDPRATLNMNDADPIKIENVDSVYFQAVTRGGRPFDRIQGKKVIFKDVSSKIGDIGAIGGWMILSNAGSEETAVVGLGVLGIGLGAKLLSTATKTKADIRQWEPLPDSIGLYKDSIAGGVYRISMAFPRAGSAAAAIHIPPPGEGLAVILAFPEPAPFLVTPSTN